MTVVVKRLASLAAMAAILFVTATAPSAVQAQGTAQPQGSEKGADQLPVFNEVQLNDKIMRSFLAAQAKVIALGVQAPTNEKEELALQGRYEQIAKDSGFANYEALDDAAQTIAVVMSGLDPETGAYTEEAESIKQEIEAIKADPQIPDADKKQIIAERQEQLAVAQPLKYRSNIDIVKKFRKEIEAVMQ